MNPPIPKRPGTREILPPSKADSIYLLPDGRRILFEPEGDHGTFLLDIVTGVEILLSKERLSTKWLGDELLYGESSEGQDYLVDLQGPTVVKLEVLPANDAALPAEITASDDVYAWSVGEEGRHKLLLLKRNSFQKVTEGYIVRGARNLEVLLAGISYKEPEIPPYDLDLDQYPSPDSQYYYTCGGYDPATLNLYSRRGKLLQSVSTSYDLFCYSWAWDSSGVYFQEGYSSWGGHQFSPLQLLPVQP